jgi:hypothetical protein
MSGGFLQMEDFGSQTKQPRWLILLLLWQLPHFEREVDRWVSTLRPADQSTKGISVRLRRA